MYYSCVIFWHLRPCVLNTGTRWWRYSYNRNKEIIGCSHSYAPLTTVVPLCNPIRVPFSFVRDSPNLPLSPNNIILSQTLLLKILLLLSFFIEHIPVLKLTVYCCIPCVPGVNCILMASVDVGISCTAGPWVRNRATLPYPRGPSRHSTCLSLGNFSKWAL